VRGHRALIWRALDGWRAEYAEVSISADRLLARGTQLGVDPLPYRVVYALDTAPGFATSRLTVDADGVHPERGRWTRRLDLLRAPDGGWTVSADAKGDPGLPSPGGRKDALEGAIDCDLGFSPLTNTLPVLRRNLLEDGAEPEDMLMAWISVPDLAVTRAAQRYEPLPGTAVRFRSLDGEFEGFTADLELDEDGFVVRYPELAERVP
jgi:uncharacterized protein